MGLESWVWHKELQPTCPVPGDPPFPPEVSEGWCWVKELGIGGWDSGSVGERAQAGEAPREQVVLGEGKEVQEG